MSDLFETFAAYRDFLIKSIYQMLKLRSDCKSEVTLKRTCLVKTLLTLLNVAFIVLYAELSGYKCRSLKVVMVANRKTILN